MGCLHLTVTDGAQSSLIRPVSGGVPLPSGVAPAGCGFSLHGGDGAAIPLQTQVLATWEDGSARWVLLDFMLTSGPAPRTSLQLVYGDEAVPCQEEACEVPLQAHLKEGQLHLADMGAIALTMVTGDGTVCAATFTHEETECVGPVRATRQFHGAFQHPGGEHLMSLRMRVSRYSDGSLVRLEPLLLVDTPTGILQHIRELRLDLATETATSIDLGGTEWQGSPEDRVRLFQVDDETWRLEGAAGTGTRAPGWFELHTSQGRTSAVLRDFRQQWPKSLEVAPNRVSVGLFPAFSEGDFAHMTPWFKYQYLFEGTCYRLRTGQARRWEIWLGSGIDGDTLCRSVNRPLLPAAAPAAAVSTGLWGAIAPAGIAAMRDYDPWVQHLFADYCEAIETERDYGAMNWGDWFGERQVNWGNHEYDTVNQLLIQYARTADPSYFYAADAAARHSTEVDVVHAVNADLAEYFSAHWPTKGYPPRPGMVHEHSVGHVGSFYPIETIRKLFVEHGIGHNDRPYLCLDPFNLGHVWTQGMVKHYFLTGDPFIRETACRIGDNLAQLVEDGEYQFAIEDPHFGRAAGWPLLALAGVYELAAAPRYLDAMKNLVERALQRQDPCCGGWLYELYPGHCLCTTRKHVGMAGFITSILINGLSQYYLLSGDERIPPAVERAVTFLINDTWVEQRSGWRYTSCPASSFTGQMGVVMMAMVNAVRLANNPEHRRILKKAWDVKFATMLEKHMRGPGQGKAFTATLYGCAETAGLLAARHTQPTPPIPQS